MPPPKLGGELQEPWCLVYRSRYVNRFYTIKSFLIRKNKWRIIWLFFLWNVSFMDAGLPFPERWESCYILFTLSVRCEHMPESGLQPTPEKRKTHLNPPLFRQILHRARCWRMSDAPLFFQNISVSSHLSEDTKGHFCCGKRKKTSLFYWILLHNQERKSALWYFFFFNSIFVLKIPPVFMILKSCYIFLSCAPTPWERLHQVFSGTDGCGEHSIIPGQSGKSGLAFMLPTLLHLSGLAQVSAAAAAILSFAPWRGRAILGWWSVSVGGAGCCFAHCRGRCWRSGECWGRWWCLGSWWWCLVSWEGCRPASASWLECSLAGRQSSVPCRGGARGRLCSRAPGLSAASSAGTWSPPPECEPGHWWCSAGGCNACGHRASVCPSCSREQQKLECWGRGGRHPQRWWRTAQWSNLFGPPGVAGSVCPGSRWERELGLDAWSPGLWAWECGSELLVEEPRDQENIVRHSSEGRFESYLNKC